MSATYDNILVDLKSRLGAKIWLSPKDIAPLIAKSEGVQANMRSQGSFPLPVQSIGKSVGVSIYHLAEWLAYGEVKSGHGGTSKPSETPTPPLKARKPKAAKKGEYDYLLAWRASLNYQSELIAEIEKIILNEEMEDKDIPSLPKKSRKTQPF